MKISNLDILLDCKIWNVEKLIKTHEQPERIHERSGKMVHVFKWKHKNAQRNEQKNEKQNIYTVPVYSVAAAVYNVYKIQSGDKMLEITDKND